MEYIGRHAALAAAVDAPNVVALNELGAAEIITVPQGASRIARIGVSLSASIVAVASSGVTVEMVMTGNGIACEQHLPCGGIREDTTSTKGAVITKPVWFDVDIGVKAGGVIDLNAYTHGVDPGTPELLFIMAFA